MGFKDAGFSSLDDKSFHVLLGAVFQSTYVEETVFFEIIVALMEDYCPFKCS